VRTLFFEKAASGTLLALLSLCVFVMSFSIQPARAQQGTIYINADGSVDPPTAPIQRNGDVYTLTSDILQGGGVWGQQPDVIVIERDNIVFDGSGFTIHGNLNAPYLLIGNGIDLVGRNNVTIQNVNITEFNNGIFLNSSLNIIIRGNSMPENGNCICLDSTYNSSIIGNNVTRMCGIYLDSSSNNSISENNIGSPPPTYNGVFGIELNSSSTNNSISENNITGNMPGGIFLNSSCDYNSISENDISNNYDFGVRLLFSSEYNTINGNNITNNQVDGVSFDSSSELNDISGNTLENNTLASGQIWIRSMQAPAQQIWCQNIL